MDELPTQADRDAAAELIERYWSGANENMMKLAKSYRAGHSHGAFVRAMQAHRIASNTEAANAQEVLQEALFGLSARLLLSGFLDDAHNHAAYEKVVAANAALAKPTQGDL